MSDDLISTTFTDVAYFDIDQDPVEVVEFVPAEEDTSGWGVER